jgi:hypothetical protein
MKKQDWIPLIVGELKEQKRLLGITQQFKVGDANFMIGVINYTEQILRMLSENSNENIDLVLWFNEVIKAGNRHPLINDRSREVLLTVDKMIKRLLPKQN